MSSPWTTRSGACTGPVAIPSIGAMGRHNLPAPVAAGWWMLGTGANRMMGMYLQESVHAERGPSSATPPRVAEAGARDLAQSRMRSSATSA
jgi:hypothetical protein